MPQCAWVIGLARRVRQSKMEGVSSSLHRVNDPRVRVRVLIAFGCVYLCWGATFTAIRVAGMHLAPTVVSGCRSLLSATIIATIVLLQGKSLRVTRDAAWRLALVGVLFMTVNNVLLTWSETMMSS